MPIYKRQGKFQVVVRRKGFPPYFETWPTRREADADEARIEAEIRLGNRVDHREIAETTVRQLLTKYDEDVCGRDDKNGRKDSNRINAWLAERWTLLALNQDITSALRDWGDRRLREVTAATHNRDLNLLSSIFSHAIKVWGIRFVHPIMGQMKRPAGAAGEHREVLWTDEQLQAVLGLREFDPALPPTSALQTLPWTILCLRHTGLRLGQLVATRMEWLHLENPAAPWIEFPAGVVKNRKPHKLPLSTRGLAWVSALAGHRRGEDRLFPFREGTLGQAWRRDTQPRLLETRPEMGDHTLHDLRHTWTTEMVDVRKVPLLQLMKISGRESERELRRYYNPTAETLAPLMG
jgi:integrase